MKLSKVIIIVVFMGVISMAMHVSIDSDTWWHLRAGQYMVETRQLITKDVFSYTSFGEPWQYPGLWVQVLMYQIYDWFGPGGLNLWVSLMVGGIFLFVWFTTEGRYIFRAVILLFSASASAIYWAARPYLVTYLLFSIFFFLLEQYTRRGKGNLWLLPVLMIIWVNSHGGFLAGFLLMVPYLFDSIIQWLAARWLKTQNQIIQLGHQLKQLSQIFLFMLVGSFVNPGGWRIWALPFSTVSRQAEQLFIAEWQSPNFHDPYLLLFGILLIIVLAVLGLSKNQIEIYEVLLLSGFGLLGLIAVRNIFFFVIVAPAFLTRYGTMLIDEITEEYNLKLNLDLEESPRGLKNYLNYFLVLLIGLVSVLRIATFVPEEINQAKLEEEFPVKAVEYLQEFEPTGLMFNSYNFGGYLIWALPEYPVFVDGRADLHGDEIILQWYHVINGGDEWRDVFKRWGIGFVVVEPDVPLLKVLSSEGWIEIYRDDVAVVAAPGEIID